MLSVVVRLGARSLGWIMVARTENMIVLSLGRWNRYRCLIWTNGSVVLGICFRVLAWGPRSGVPERRVALCTRFMLGCSLLSRCRMCWLILLAQTVIGWRMLDRGWLTPLVRA